MTEKALYDRRARRRTPRAAYCVNGNTTRVALLDLALARRIEKRRARVAPHRALAHTGAAFVIFAPLVRATETGAMWRVEREHMTYIPAPPPFLAIRIRLFPSFPTVGTRFPLSPSLPRRFIDCYSYSDCGCEALILNILLFFSWKKLGDCRKERIRFRSILPFLFPPSPSRSRSHSLPLPPPPLLLIPNSRLRRRAGDRSIIPHHAETLEIFTRANNSGAAASPRHTPRNLDPRMFAESRRKPLAFPSRPSRETFTRARDLSALFCDFAPRPCSTYTFGRYRASYYH